MATYTVFVPSAPGDPARRAERTVFVREGFGFAAFVFGPLYLLYRRSWLASAGWVAVAASLVFLAHALDLTWPAEAGLFGLLALLTGLEAATLRQAGLQRRGYTVADLITGPTREQTERTFFGRDTARPASRPMADAGTPARAAAEPRIIGLFPQAGDD